jgi:hypothetical protein
MKFGILLKMHLRLAKPQMIFGVMLVGEANSLVAFVQERKKIIVTGKNHAKSVKLAHILGKQIATKNKNLKQWHK